MADKHILVQILECLEGIRQVLGQQANRVLGGVMFQVEDPMVLVAPGNQPQFAVTPSPAGTATVAAQTAWSSSDSVNAPVTMLAADPTGLTAQVSLSKSAVVGHSFTLTWKYTNSDGSVVAIAAAFTITATPGNVGGGTIAQIA